jgi:DNA-binding transcriptional MerR regulator
MEQSAYIGEVSRELGVTPRYLRRLESQGMIPRANRDALGRIYSAGDVALLKALGVGSRPYRLRRVSVQV